jgi:hypothetical protein
MDATRIRKRVGLAVPVLAMTVTGWVHPGVTEAGDVRNNTRTNVNHDVNANRNVNRNVSVDWNVATDVDRGDHHPVATGRHRHGRGSRLHVAFAAARLPQLRHHPRQEDRGHRRGAQASRIRDRLVRQGSQRPGLGEQPDR